MEDQGRNIVLCFDGTRNEYGVRNTNVVRLFSLLDKHSDRQITFYDPGVGTISPHPALFKLSRSIYRIAGYVIAFGLTANIEEGYRFLMNHYRPGDRIYMFGFSRGAYTARALAGMIYKCGLLPPGNENLLPYAMRMYKYKPVGIARGFKKEFGQKGKIPIHFLGLWDTVKSVGWVWSTISLAFTANNPDIRTARHAVAIDERRAFFRQHLFGSKHKKSDIRQVWFAGVHSDVGGSYPVENAGLARITQEWMLIEAHKAGLLFDYNKAIQAVKNTPPLNDVEYRKHTSLKGGWHAAELIPKENYSKRWHSIYPRANLWRHRVIPDGVTIHASVPQRMKDVPAYRPKNLPSQYNVEPWRKLKSELSR